MNIVNKIVLSIVVPTLVVTVLGAALTRYVDGSPVSQLATYVAILLTIVASSVIAVRRIVVGRLSKLTARLRAIDTGERSGENSGAANDVIVDDDLDLQLEADFRKADGLLTDVRGAMSLEEIHGDDLVHLAKALDDLVAEWWAERDMLRKFIRSLQNELRRTRAHLAQESRRADASVSAKREFLVNVSHEIRTPMNGIMGMCELLLDSEIGGEEREHAVTIRQSAETLMSVLADVLDFSRLTAGDLTIEPIPCDVATTVREIVDVYARQAREKKLDVRLSYDPNTPRHLLIDAARLRQVLSSLLSNAVKFTNEGWIEVSVTATRVTDTTACMRFTVEDTGIGVSHEQLSYIFEGFTQVDSSMSRRQGGTGLGLAVCKQLARLMGGEIEVESRLEEGSSFSFVASFDACTDLDSKTLQLAPLEGIRALFVDDNPVNRRVLVRQLSRWGVRADVKSDPTEVIEALREAKAADDPYAICVIDYQMPEMTGEELAEAIKAEPLVASTPLVMLTSMSSRGDAKRMRKAGFSGYLVKPIPRDRLRDALSAVLGSVSAGDRDAFITQHTLAEHRMATGEGRTVAPSAFRGRALIAEDNPVNQMLAKRMLQKLGIESDVAPNGEAAVECVAEKAYDIIFMDCQMPIMDGVEATRRIRATDEREVGVPIIAMTANALQQEKTRCLEAGMDDFITKPVDLGMLREILSRFLPAGEGGASGSTEERAA